MNNTIKTKNYISKEKNKQGIIERMKNEEFLEAVRSQKKPINIFDQGYGQYFHRKGLWEKLEKEQKEQQEVMEAAKRRLKKLEEEKKLKQEIKKEILEKVKNQKPINIFESKEFLDEKLEKGRQQFLENEREEKAQRERLKIERVKASGNPPLIYMLDIIIEYCITQPDRATFSIHSDQLGIEDDLRVITRRRGFLNQLKNKGIFKNIEITPYNDFIFIEPNIKKLKEYKQKLIKKLSPKTLSGKIPQKQKKSNKIQIFINKEKGIYKNNSKKNYPIKGRKRPQILNDLKDGKKDGKILSRNYKNLSQLNKEIKEINTNFKKKLNLKKDLIIHVPTGGYEFNNTCYKIKFTNSN